MSVEPSPASDDRAVPRLFGAMLMVVGGLIIALCGLCSLGVVGMVLVDVFRSPAASGDVVTMVPMVAIFGGVPIAVGFGVFFLGRGLYRGPKAPP
jgi:hypothetical protein